MKLPFSKMHGLGNDFIMIDNRDGSIELTADQVAMICDRHFGVGADGVILVEASQGHEDGFMNYINSDGTFAQMCGNGVRCFAKYLVDYGYVDPASKHLAALTRAGVKDIVFETDDEGKLVYACVDMGEPILRPDLVPIAMGANEKTPEGTAFVCDVPIDSPWGEFKFSAVSMGNPHAICFIDDFKGLPDELFLDPACKNLDTLNLDLIGAWYESNAAFPEKANIEFAVIRDDGISMRVFERGCGETLACGTGACATSVAATLSGRASRMNAISLKGGVLEIDWKEDNHVYMSGPAKESFTGILTLE